MWYRELKKSVALPDLREQVLVTHNETNSALFQRTHELLKAQ